MVIVYRCSKCGAVLYVVKVSEKRASKRRRYRSVIFKEYRVLETYPAPKEVGILTPEEVARYYGGRCPFCGAELGDVKKIRIGAADSAP